MDQNHSNSHPDKAAADQPKTRDEQANATEQAQAEAADKRENERGYQ